MNNDSRHRVQWLSEGPDRGPEHGLRRALAATRRSRQRPAWMSVGGWMPMKVRMPHAVSRSLVLLPALALLVGALGLSLLATGTRPALTLSTDAAPDPNAGAPDGSSSNAQGKVDRPIAFMTRAGANGAALVLLDERGGRRTFRVPPGRCASLSPDGSQVAFHARRGEPGDPGSAFAIQALDRPEEDRLVGAGWTTPDNVVAWSPSGSEVAAVVTSGTRQHRELRVFVVDGSGDRSILPDGFAPTEPVWSPDGHWIAFYGSPKGELGLYIVRPDGSEIRRLAEVHSGYRPEGISWSPDATSIAFVSRARGVTMVADIDPVDVFIVGVDGSGLANLTRTPRAQERWPRWSPDGTRLAFTASKDGGIEGTVHVLDLRRGAWGPFGATGAIAWSPAGDRMAVARFPGRDADVGELWIFPLDEGEPPRRMAGGVLRRCPGPAGTLQW